MCDLSSLEHASYSNLAPILQKLLSLPNVGLQVVLRNTRTDLYTLYFLLFALFVFALLALHILVSAVVDDSANGGLSTWTDHDKVESLFFCLGESLTALHDS